MKKRTILILLILTLSIYATNFNAQSAVEENNYRSTSLELTPHDPIYITSDSDFNVFPGTGIEIDPYVIDGYNITTTEDYGIYITETTKYFIVCNCYVDVEEYGIYIDEVVYGTATVINNTCSNNGYDGIKLKYSGNSTVENNMCNNNVDDSIVLWSSGSSNVENNTCNNNNRGIYLVFSGSSNVANNTCSNNNNYGIWLHYSGSSNVANNTFTNCGLCISEDTIDAYLSYIVENNWVNGKKLGFYTNLDSIIISEPVYGQLKLVNCTNVTVRDQILNNATTGLSLCYCTYSVIINITCNNNNNRGIYLWSSGSSTVANNTCSNNGMGIYLCSSSSSIVANNTCNNNYCEGIRLYCSSSSTVANNTCNNNYYGILLWSSDFCVVTYNLLQENEGYGVYLIYDSDNNLIHHNTFVDNNLEGTSQAYDDCVNNTWYDTATLEGNYWSDWSGIGSYSIDGDANSVDLYPLVEPVIVEYPQIVLITLLLSIVPLFLTRIISKKAKKK